jgi:hypothetical protein
MGSFHPSSKKDLCHFIPIVEVWVNGKVYFLF